MRTKVKMTIIGALILVAMLATLFGACSKPAPTPTPTVKAPTPTPSLQVVPTPTPVPKATPTPTVTQRPMEPVSLLWNGGPFSAVSVPGKTMQWFGDEVTKRTNGLVTFKYAWSFALTKPGEELKALKSGVSALASFTAGYYPSELYLNSLSYACMFGVTDMDVIAAMSEKYTFDYPWLPEEFEKQGAKLLSTLPAYPFWITSRVPINKLEDFKGLKIGITSRYEGKFLAAVGAVAVPTTAADRGTALQTGMLDGSALPLDLTVSFKHYEFAKYEFPTDWFGQISSQSLVMSLDKFNALPKDVQKIFLDVGKAAIKYAANLQKELYDTQKKTIKDAGVTLLPGLTWDDKVKWANLAGDRWVLDWIDEGEKMGKPARLVMEKYFELVKAAGHKWPKEWPLK